MLASLSVGEGSDDGGEGDEAADMDVEETGADGGGGNGATVSDGALSSHADLNVTVRPKQALAYWPMGKHPALHTPHV